MASIIQKLIDNGDAWVDSSGDLVGVAADGATVSLGYWDPSFEAMDEPMSTRDRALCRDTAVFIAMRPTPEDW